MSSVKYVSDASGFHTVEEAQHIAEQLRPEFFSSSIQGIGLITVNITPDHLGVGGLIQKSKVDAYFANYDVVYLDRGFSDVGFLIPYFTATTSKLRMGVVMLSLEKMFLSNEYNYYALQKKKDIWKRSQSKQLKIDDAAMAKQIHLELWQHALNMSQFSWLNNLGTFDKYNEYISMIRTKQKIDFIMFHDPNDAGNIQMIGYITTNIFVHQNFQNNIYLHRFLTEYQLTV